MLVCYPAYRNLASGSRQARTLHSVMFPKMLYCTKPRIFDLLR